MANKGKWFAVAVLSVIITGIAVFMLFSDRNSVNQGTGDGIPSVGSIKTGQTYTDLPEKSVEQSFSVKETSAGYYLYDRDSRPIMNDGIIDTESSGKMEFNIECVNTCKLPLNYTLVILVNDFCQEVDYKKGGVSFHGNGVLQGGESETVNARFKIKSPGRNADNELRIIMFYYTEDVPESELEQVVVGDSVGIYTLSGITGDNGVPENNLRDVSSYDADTKDDIMAVWLTERECRSVPKYDFILDVTRKETVYFNSMGEDKKYTGMLFVDGLPVKISGYYAFSYEQKKGCLMSCELTDKLKGGSTAFAYVYESGNRKPDRAYTTNLYRLNYRGEP